MALSEKDIKSSSISSYDDTQISQSTKQITAPRSSRRKKQLWLSYCPGEALLLAWSGNWHGLLPRKTKPQTHTLVFPLPLSIPPKQRVR